MKIKVIKGGARVKIKVISLLMISLLSFTACTKNILLDEQNSKLLNYSFKIKNSNNIDKTLKKQRYVYSSDINKKYIAVITYQSHDASMNQYLLSENETKNLIIPKNSKFVISLYANSMITYTWKIKNNIDNGIIQLENRSWISIPFKSTAKSTGTNYDRQNLYFNPLKTGSEQVVLMYEHQTQTTENPFKITLNIKIQ